ncbi:MAG: carbamoyltransferase [Lewinellaceae bacterium]|nr:carbamoyltransferase [Saprospiraceae bacterium]MCB9338361.1 carbamoyltransferase [Lewinellaceae bacterium]
MYTLGINAYHGDSSACIYRDGELIAATEEERIRRIKHWAGLPTEAVKFCLQEAGIKLDEVDVITVSRNPWAKFGYKIMHTLKNRSTVKSFKAKASHIGGVRTIKEDMAHALGYNGTPIKADIKFIEHHRSHMGSAFFVSPFEESAILSVDGMGDFTSTMRGIGKGNKITVLDSVTFPHSIGYFYTCFTQYLGFPNYGDEYKVMGLAPYGTPDPDLMKKIWDFMRLKSDGLFELNLKYLSTVKHGDWGRIDEKGIPVLKPHYSGNLVAQFGPARQKGEPLTDFHKNLAASVQRVTEETIFHLAEGLYKKTGLKNLCITGGVAQNSVANGKVVDNTSFENLFVPPAGHDGGTCVGSALFHYHNDLGKPRSPFKHQAYTGIYFTNDKIRQFLKTRDLSQFHVAEIPDEKLFNTVADALIGGCVVGWYQGRAEFGPRALGNRSIIVDPRRADAKDLMNEKIKRRESFRPFAPSILKECTAAYFERVDDVPFMEKVFRIRPEKQASIPAVTHVDGTGRLQTVEQIDAPRYHALISAFNKKTGVPILLNTSFNENEPIVNTPEHALECFLRTQMDMLVLENFVVSRKPLPGN